MKSFQQLKSELDNGSIQNLYVFVGEEKEVLKKYVKRVAELGSHQKKAEEVSDFTTAWRLFTMGRLLKFDRCFVVHNAEIPEQIDLKRLVKTIGSDTLILIYDKVDARKKLFKQLDSFTTEFKKFSEQQLAGIIQKQLPEVSTQLAQVISKYCNNEVSRIELEVNKLLHLPYGSGIDLELVNELISAPLEDRIFDMVDAVAKKQPKRAFELYSDLIELNESPIKIVSLLYTKFKQVFLVQAYFKMNNNELAEKTGLTYYQVQYARDLCGNFTTERLLQILRKVQETEVSMKTGKEEIGLSMDNLLLEVLS